VVGQGGWQRVGPSCRHVRDCCFFEYHCPGACDVMLCCRSAQSTPPHPLVLHSCDCRDIIERTKSTTTRDAVDDIVRSSGPLPALAGAHATIEVGSKQPVL
jgi:hypothetical protein